MFVSSDYLTARQRDGWSALGAAEAVHPPSTPFYSAGYVGSIRNQDDRHDAIRLVKAGVPVGIYVRGVATTAVDTANPGAVDTIYRMKGERRTGRPMQTLQPLATLVRMIDPERISPALRAIFLDPQELERRLGTLCSVRVPIRRQVVGSVPPELVRQSDDGTYWLQSWVSDQTNPASLLVKELHEQGVLLPAVTSMNESGEPEIIDQRNALAYCALHRIPFFLGDRQSRSTVRGSFPILQVDPDGVRVIRQGHFSARLFRRLLDGASVDPSRALPAKYPLMDTDSLESVASPYKLHDRLVALLDGKATK